MKLTVIFFSCKQAHWDQPWPVCGSAGGKYSYISAVNGDQGAIMRSGEKQLDPVCDE